jgi:hypothetical protein
MLNQVVHLFDVKDLRPGIVYVSFAGILHEQEEQNKMTLCRLLQEFPQ